MTTIDAADATCRGCAAPWRPGARFCPHCGNQAPPGPPAPRRTAPQAAVPTQGWAGPPGPHRPPPTPPAPPWAPPFPPVGPPPAPEQRRSNRGLVVVACVLALVAVVLGAFLVVGMPWSAGAGASTAAGPAPTSATVPALPADPAQALETQRGADAGAAEALVGSWAPQLSAKKQGLVVDGQTYDAATILADHQRLRGQQPDAILVWSGDFTSFRSRDFWITMANRPFSTSDAANAWCRSAGFGPDDCYAKRLSHTGGYAENTAMRTDAGTTGGGTTGGSPAAGSTPVLGDARWVPGGAGWGTIRPPEINANGDGTSYVDGVTWQSWGGAQATGRGTASWVPPNGASSDGVQRPAVVVATNLGDCHGRLAYRSVGWYFPTEGETSLPPGNGYEDICDGT